MQLLCPLPGPNGHDFPGFHQGQAPAPALHSLPDASGVLTGSRPNLRPHAFPGSPGEWGTVGNSGEPEDDVGHGQVTSDVCIYIYMIYDRYDIYIYI